MKKKEMTHSQLSNYYMNLANEMAARFPETRQNKHGKPFTGRVTKRTKTVWYTDSRGYYTTRNFMAEANGYYRKGVLTNTTACYVDSNNKWHP
jgi:hypothetical protein